MGVFELRLFFGPGYRLYFGVNAGQSVVLLCAGDKSSQQRDIERAVEYWMDYTES
jgi:putative addiction module killer protein